MKAMILNQICQLKDNPEPLRLVELDEPAPQAHEILVKVSTCGVCHTELDEIEGRTPPPRLPVVLGHQIVGTVAARGPLAERYRLGDRVGIAWIYSACGQCSHCLEGNENLCGEFKATGRDAPGGYAEFTVVDENFAYRIPPSFSDSQAAPLLCAGAIGYRSMRLSRIEDGQYLGLTGFGASAHLVLKMVQHLYPHAGVFVFARSEHERKFARQLGAVWAGDTTDVCPEKLHSIIDTTPAWKPVVEALKNLKAGGRLVINAIRKEDFDQAILLDVDYAKHLWMEKEIKSVANVTRQDVKAFLQTAAEIRIQPEFQEYALQEANQALNELRTKKIRGAKVLVLG